LFVEIFGNVHQTRGINRFATIINQAHGAPFRRRIFSTKEEK